MVNGTASNTPINIPSTKLLKRPQLKDQEVKGTLSNTPVIILRIKVFRTLKLKARHSGQGIKNVEAHQVL
jgi:hypothetical protein